ncbi:hypothetical protein [Methylobacterium gossipiicola]|uniref:HNH endonuclease n=1 Tax=Methylobacterium gossipiicola TaxID=582675 RepID=A0A1I2TE78_9HYPH|nr:hypothetical protein [Methylobacterium gossipiicola]SFG63202.1 hypothetical protein SAMN05192565_10721 [Methylobacterium gossipiicola]
MARNTIFHATDPSGVALIGVSLALGRTAWLYRSDFERIDALHPDGRWGVTHNSEGRIFVRIRPPRTQRNIYVARLVAGDFERTVVRYRDGNSMNLRPTNLKHDNGGGGRPRRHSLG